MEMNDLPNLRQSFRLLLPVHKPASNFCLLCQVFREAVRVDARAAVQAS